VLGADPFDALRLLRATQGVGGLRGKVSSHESIVYSL